MINSKKYHLFLDDARMPKDVKWIELPMVKWVIVRNYDEFVNTIKRDGLPISVSFDHDLADEHYQEYHISHDEKMLSKGTFRYDKCKEKTGYHCAQFLANYCVDNNLDIPQYYLHTMNPIGRVNMFSILESARKVIESRKVIKCDKCGHDTGTGTLHSCPYASEINDNNTEGCNCCDSCSTDCAMDI